jgi:hypothetical protein
LVASVSLIQALGGGWTRPSFRLRSRCGAESTCRRSRSSSGRPSSPRRHAVPALRAHAT